MYSDYSRAEVAKIASCINIDGKVELTLLIEDKNLQLLLRGVRV